MAHLEENRSGSPPELVGPLLTGRADPRPERYVPLIIAVGLLLAWEAGVRLSLVSSLFFPAPSAIGRSLLDLWQSGDLFAHTGA